LTKDTRFTLIFWGYIFFIAGTAGIAYSGLQKGAGYECGLLLVIGFLCGLTARYHRR